MNINKKTFNNLEFTEKKFTRLLSRFSVKEREELVRCYLFAKDRHGKQKRYEGTPYIIHPLRCACYVIEKLEIKDLRIIHSALLHDTLEDTQTKYEEVEGLFGEEVGDLVFELTRPRRKNESERTKQQSKLIHLRKLLAKASHKIKILKAVDLLDNLRSHQFITDLKLREKKLHRWLKEVKIHGLEIAKVDPVIYKDMKEMLDYYCVG